jgi:hypothetical protein
MFFFEKRTKKLLSVSGSTEFTRPGPMQRAMSKSFLLLFFEKEDFFCGATPA